MLSNKQKEPFWQIWNIPTRINNYRYDYRDNYHYDSYYMNYYYPYYNMYPWLLNDYYYPYFYNYMNSHPPPITLVKREFTKK